MRIAQLISNFHITPPKASLAIYHLVGLLTRGLVENGHDVTLYATKDSNTPAKLEYVTETGTSCLPNLDKETRVRLMHLLISRCYEHAATGIYDIVHSHFNLSSCYYAPIVDTPTVHTFHSPLDESVKQILRYYKDKTYFISVSHAQRNQMPELNWMANIYHGVNTMKYTFSPNAGKHLLFMSRITEEKGVHFAIEAAKAVNMPLVIAGKSYLEEGYWQKHVETHIDGVNIKYIGEPDHETKINYLRSAKALLFPTLYQEVFGMVMIEAMSCGTPVIGFRNGAVPEIVKDGVTGFLVEDTASMVKAIKKLDKIDRKACRERVEKFFRLQIMVENYEKVYARIIEIHKQKTQKK